MSAIAWELPEEIRAVRDGLIDFARKEVLPRHDSIATCSRTRAGSIARTGDSPTN